MSWNGKKLHSHLRTRRFGRQARHFGELDSTNRWLTENWNDFTLSGAVVTADHQISGRGRFLRRWEDVPAKSLIFSILLRGGKAEGKQGFQQMLPAISLARVIDARLRDVADVHLKWPNDVLINGGKVAGILAERFSAGANLVTIVGIGINVAMRLDEFPESIRDHATSIYAETGTQIERELLMAEILNEWEPLYDSLREGRHDEIREAWMQFGPALESPITRHEHDSELAGAFCGIGDNGQLLLRDNSGKMHELYSGDIRA